MIGIGGTLFSQEKIWDTEFAVRVSRDTQIGRLQTRPFLRIIHLD